MKNIILLSILALLILSSCSKDEPTLSHSLFSDTIEYRDHHDFCMVSYNIKGFCEGIGPDDVGDAGGPTNFANQICDYISGADGDILNLQEVWCEEAIPALENCLSDLGYTHFASDPESGLLTATKPGFEFEEEPEIVPFQTTPVGADAFKAKGFISTRIALEEDCFINVLNTHLQADRAQADEFIDIGFSLTGLGPVLSGLINLFGGNAPTPGAIVLSPTRVRAGQLAEIKAHLMEEDDCILTVIGGDLNIDSGTDEFDNMLNLFVGQPIHLTTPDPTSINSGKILDYYLISNFNIQEEMIDELETEVYAPECEITTIFTMLCKLDSADIPEGDDEEIFLPWQTFDNRPDAYQALEDAGPLCVDGYILKTTTKKCIRNISDHRPIRTCMEYDCDAQRECRE